LVIPSNSTVRFVESPASSQPQPQQTHQIISMAHPTSQPSESPTHMIIQRAATKPQGQDSVSVSSTGGASAGPTTQIKISGKKFPTSQAAPRPAQPQISRMTPVSAPVSTPVAVAQPIQAPSPQTVPQAIPTPPRPQPEPATPEPTQEPERRYSSDGSTTISAPNSPSMDDVDDDEMDNEMFINRIRSEGLTGAGVPTSTGRSFKFGPQVGRAQGEPGRTGFQEGSAAGPSGVKHHPDFRGQDEGPKKKAKKPK
jgi:hypothetical protein